MAVGTINQSVIGELDPIYRELEDAPAQERLRRFIGGNDTRLSAAGFVDVTLESMKDADASTFQEEVKTAFDIDATSKIHRIDRQNPSEPALLYSDYGREIGFSLLSLAVREPESFGEVAETTMKALKLFENDSQVDNFEKMIVKSCFGKVFKEVVRQHRVYREKLDADCISAAENMVLRLGLAKKS